MRESFGNQSIKQREIFKVFSTLFHPPMRSRPKVGVSKTSS